MPRLLGRYRNRLLVLVPVVLVVGLVASNLAGCSAFGPSHPDVVRVGAIYPLSGSLASTGQSLTQAVSLAQEIVNEEYDLDLPLAQSSGLPGLGNARLEVVFADHEGDPERGAEVATGLIEGDALTEGEGVTALLGCYNSSVTARASQIAEASGVPFLNAASTSPTLTERGYRWFFRTTADDAIFAKNFFQFLQEVDEQQGLRTRDVALVYENTLWGTGVSQMEKTYAGQFGFNVVADVPYASDAESVEQEVKTLLETGAPIVMQASYVGDAILTIQTYEEMGFQPTALLAMDAGFISPGFVERVGAEASYVLSREVWAQDLGEQRPLVQQVDDLYVEMYGGHMDGNSARAFTGLLVLADAINRAGSTDPEAIREALLETDIPGERMIMPWEGVRFDAETGQNLLARGIIVQLWDGVYHTVWPWDMASEELVWPMSEGQ